MAAVPHPNRLSNHTCTISFPDNTGPDQPADHQVSDVVPNKSTDDPPPDNPNTKHPHTELTVADTRPDVVAHAIADTLSVIFTNTRPDAVAHAIADPSSDNAAGDPRSLDR